MRLFRIHSLAVLLVFLFSLAACGNKTSPAGQPATEKATSVATAEPSFSPETDEPVEKTADVELPDPLNNLLSLRGIRFSLTSVRSDGTSRSISGEIDAVGSMRLTYAKPENSLQEIDPELTGIMPAMTYEIYLINGTAYTSAEVDPAWADRPLDPDYLPVLSSQLHSLDGFTLWLDMLPAGSLQPAGSEKVGGFAAEKYMVNGLIGDQPITGALWYEPSTHSLIQAELHVPAALDSDPETPESGEILITLSTEKVEVQPLPVLTNQTSQGAPAEVNTPPTQTALTEPTIINTYQVSDMPYHPGGAEGIVLALPNGIWTVDLFSGLQQFDPQTGNLVKKVPLDAKYYFDLKYDGERLWVLASKEESGFADILYGLDLPSGNVAASIPVTKQGIYNQSPIHLGYSPGRIWVNFGVVDTETYEYTIFPDGLPSEAAFAFDGKRWMWITGSWCQGCGHDLWIFDTLNLPETKDDENSGVLETGVLGNPLTLAGGRIWVVAVYYTDDGPSYFLDGYDLDQTASPVMHVDVTAEVEDDSGDLHLAADDNRLWLAADGVLTYFDALTGEKMGSLEVGEYISSMSFDGADLWVLCQSVGLVQVDLPWEQ